MIEVRQFQLLLAIERGGSLTSAARELGLSQPAVTQQVQQLERQMRVPLVFRARSRTRLTEAGYTLLRHGRAIVNAVQLAEAEVAAVAGLQGGRVRIAAFQSAAATLLPGAITAMARRHPGVVVTMVEAEPPDAIEMLSRGDCEIAVIYQYSTDTTTTTEKFAAWSLLEDRVLVALSASHRAASWEHIDLADLQQERWIAGCPRCRGHLVDACHAAGFEPQIAFEIDDYVALQRFAAEGLGVALIPQLGVANVQLTGLELRQVVPSTFRRVTALAPGETSRMPAAQEMLRALQAAANTMSRGLSAAGAALPAS